MGRKKRVWATPRTPSVEEAVINILHNTPEPAPSKYPARNILSCLAHNEPGVISRVSGILQSRGFNIESLVAAHTELPGLSRMTVVLNGDHKQLEQAKRQLEDLVRTNEGQEERKRFDILLCSRYPCGPSWITVAHGWWSVNCY